MPDRYVGCFELLLLRGGLVCLCLFFFVLSLLSES